MTRSVDIGVLVACIALALADASPASAQGYPAKPVKIVVPFPGGGIVDIVTRAVTEKIAQNWGTPIVVEPRPGAGGLVGTEAVATAAPDGYTMLVATIGIAVGPLLISQFRYDLRKDFAAVGMFATSPNVAVVPLTLPAGSLAELVELARQSPGRLNYAHTGAGTSNHLPVELLKVSRGIQLVPVAYKGQPQAITDLLSGQIHLLFGAPAFLMPYVKSGRLKAIAVTSSKRLDDAPGIPTLEESGFGDIVGGSGWYGIAAPARLRIRARPCASARSIP